MASKRKGRKPATKGRKPVAGETGHRKTMPIEANVDNPMYIREHDGAPGNEKTIKALINMRESPSAHWFHKDIIDAAQYRASTEFRRLWERTGGKGAGSYDYSKEKVDGGQRGDPIDIGQMEASRQLMNIRQLIGSQSDDIVLKICGQCIAIDVGQDARPRQLPPA